jgi:lysophospholipase L1-like esterase
VANSLLKWRKLKRKNMINLVDTSSFVNLGNGDPLRDALEKINNNFTELKYILPSQRSFQTAAVLGDSITAAWRSSQQGNAWNTRAASYLFQIQEIMGASLYFNASNIFAIGGINSLALINDGYLAQMILANADLNIMMVGTNDPIYNIAPNITASGVLGLSAAIALSISSLNIIADRLMATGKPLIAIVPLPSNSYVDSSQTNTKHMNAIRSWYRKKALEFPTKFFLCDPESKLIDGATNGILFSMATDGTHPEINGDRVIAIELAKVLNRFVVPFDRLHYNNADLYDATNLNGNLIQNGAMIGVGSGNISGAGASGILAPNWSCAMNQTGRGGVTAILSKLARPNGEYQQITIGGTAPTTDYDVSITANVTTPIFISAGDYIYGIMEYELDANSANIRCVSIDIAQVGGSFRILRGGVGDNSSLYGRSIIDSTLRKGVVVTEPILVEAGRTSFSGSARIYVPSGVAPSGVIRIGGFAVRKCTKDGRPL